MKIRTFYHSSPLLLPWFGKFISTPRSNCWAIFQTENARIGRDSPSELPRFFLLVFFLWLTDSSDLICRRFFKGISAWISPPAWGREIATKWKKKIIELSQISPIITNLASNHYSTNGIEPKIRKKWWTPLPNSRKAGTSKYSYN